MDLYQEVVFRNVVKGKCLLVPNCRVPVTFNFVTLLTSYVVQQKFTVVWR